MTNESLKMVIELLERLEQRISEIEYSISRQKSPEDSCIGMDTDLEFFDKLAELKEKSNNE